MEPNITSINLSKDLLNKYKNSGYYYCKDIPETEITNLLNTTKTVTALELYSEELINGCILTYYEELDNLIRNEFIPKSIVEIAGEFVCSKTHLCLQLCISVQVPKIYGGLEGKAIYLSTKYNFPINKFQQLADIFYKKLKKAYPDCEFTIEKIMDNVLCRKIRDCDQLLACLHFLKSYLLNKNVRLIIIDSVSIPLRFDENVNRKEFIATFFGILRYLMKIHNFCTVLTNDLTTKIDEKEVLTTPSFGDTFYHLVNSRILLSKNGPCLNAKLLKSTLQNVRSINYFVG